MKASWRKLETHSTVAVTHELSEAATSSWAELSDAIQKALDIATNEHVLVGLAQRFSLSPDVTFATLDGATLTTQALCPASAWLFNRNVEAMLSHAPPARPNQISELATYLGRFGFQKKLSNLNGSQFLQEARQAGYDVIRTSSQFPNYVIRNLKGNKISVLQNFTGATSHIATKTSTDKLVTAEMLTLAGLPTPKTYNVPSANEASKIFEREALRSAVIKPRGTDRGLGVHTALRTDAELSTAFNNARKYGGVVMQEHVAGDDFRILVADDDVMGVTRRTPFSILGDGFRSIRELMEEKIKWRASHPFYKHFNKISIHSSDTQLMLQKQGLTYESIPAMGLNVVLRSNANVSTGGEHEDVTEQCHHEIKTLARECASLFGLDLAGIDYISTDIKKSWKSTNGKVCEINPTPALSVNGVPSKIFSRFDSLEPVSDPKSIQGDILYVTDCSCKSAHDLRRKYSQHTVLNLTACSEAQYFFQSYLVTKNTNFLLLVTSEMLEKYGVINSNIRTLLFCEACATSSINNPMPINSPHPLTRELI